MATKLVLDLDTLTKEKALLFVGIILAIAGCDSEEIPEALSLDPAAVFGAASQSGIVDTNAPHVEIPPPPPALQVVPPPPPPPAVAPMSANAPVITPNSAGSAPVATNTFNDVDSSGLPWDGRIHASSKAKNADGTWRLKRGVEKTQVDSITAELRRVMAAPGPGPQLVPPPPSAATIPPPPAPAAADASPVALSPDLRKSYVELIGRAASAQGAGKITVAQVNSCLAAVGVESMHGLANRLDLVAAAASLIDGIIAGQNA